MLEGKCNQCGLCCYDNELRCIYLVIKGKIGTPGATECSQYKSRFNEMPIFLVDRQQKLVAPASCAMGNQIEELEILAKGIGRGCSLTFRAGDNDKGRTG